MKIARTGVLVLAMLVVLNASGSSADVADSAATIVPLLIGADVPDSKVKTVQGKEVGLPCRTRNGLCDAGPYGHVK